MTDYYTKVKKIGKGSYGSVKLFESKIDLKGPSSLANQILAYLKQRGSGNFLMF